MYQKIYFLRTYFHSLSVLSNLSKYQENHLFFKSIGSALNQIKFEMQDMLYIYPVLKYNPNA